MVMLALLLGTSPLYSQINIGDKIKNKTLNKADQKVDQGIDKGLEEVEKSVNGTPEDKNKDADNDAEENKDGAEEKPAAASPQQPQKTPLSTYSKYDFIPGENVIFFEDFSQDKVGDYPALWYTNKGGEVMTTNNYPGNWFMMKEEGMQYLEKGFNFPENYTLEYDVIPVPVSEESQSVAYDMTILATDQEGLYPVMAVPGRSGVVFNLATPNGQHYYSTYSEGNYVINGDYSKEAGLLKMNEINHISIWVQKTRFRLYIHGEKIFDIPKAFQPGHQYNQIRFYTNGEGYPLITNIRIADAGADTRSKLLTEGKLVTRGITFDTGSDVIKPLSYGVLKEIATVLKDNPTVRVKIIGHTDSDGDDQSNLVLSQKRAVAVKNALSKEFAIDAARMETDGKGEKEPSSPNTTAEGKANNRRVEFIKL